MAMRQSMSRFRTPSGGSTEGIERKRLVFGVPKLPDRDLVARLRREETAAHQATETRIAELKRRLGRR